MGPGKECGLMKHRVLTNLFLHHAESRERCNERHGEQIYSCEGEDWWHNKCNQKS